jgi:hypothetical protein
LGEGPEPESISGLDAEHPPISELAEFELEADEELSRRIQGSINRTRTATSMVDLSTRGFWGLLMDYITTIFSAVFSPRESGRGNADKEG